MRPAEQAERAAREAHRSPSVRAGARLGLAARGLVWTVLGLLAVRVALGDHADADQDGALRAIAAQPVGAGLLVAVAVGFAGHALFQLIEAALGQRGTGNGLVRSGERIASLVRAVVYAVFAVMTVQVLTGGGGGDSTPSLTARAMSLPAGRVLVGLTGAVVLAVGAGMAVRALRRDHDDDLDAARLPQRYRRPAVALGVVGLVGRGVVLGLVGLFVVRAAWQFDPNEARGLDAALQTVAAQTYGQLLLLAAATGLLAFGLWSFVESACRRL